MLRWGLTRISAMAWEVFWNMYHRPRRSAQTRTDAANAMGDGSNSPLRQHEAELRPSGTPTLPLLAPWEHLVKVHYRSLRSRPGVGYRHLRPNGVPTGLEWLCIGTQLPHNAHMQGPAELGNTLQSLAAQWDPTLDWTSKTVALHPTTWKQLGVHSITYASTVRITARNMSADRNVSVVEYYLQPRSISYRGFVAADDNRAATTAIGIMQVSTGIGARQPPGTQ